MTEEHIPYGPHLTVDLRGDVDLPLTKIAQFMNGLVREIGMTKITEPYVFVYAPEDKAVEEHGITGVVIIAESHISIHTYPLKNYAFLDVFSWREFDLEKCKNYVDGWFHGDHIYRLTKRGLDFPR